MKSDQLVEELLMGMAAEAGCVFEKIRATNIRLLPREKDIEVSRLAVRVHADNIQALKSFDALLMERTDRMFKFEAEGSLVYEYEAFGRKLRAFQRSGVLSLIIFL